MEIFFGRSYNSTEIGGLFGRTVATMERLETKAYEAMAAELFWLAYLKQGNFVEVAGKVGTSGRHASDVAKGEKQPTVPIYMACLAEQFPWLPEEITKCVRKETERILAQRKAEAAAKAAKEGGVPHLGCLPGEPEEAHA